MPELPRNVISFYIVPLDPAHPAKTGRGTFRPRAPTRMPYRILADIVVLIHFLWILFLFLGAFWGIKNKVARIFHLSGLAFAFIIQIFDWYCPLTHLEIWLRSKHSPSLTYAGSFIIHYVEKIVYIDISRFAVFVFTILLCGLNAWLYFKRRR